MRAIVIGILLFASVAFPADTVIDLAPAFCKITDPENVETFYEGTELSFYPHLPGEWLIECWVTYAHEDPDNPGHNYVAYTSKVITVGGQPLLFADNFESGDAGRWSSIHP